ncbi:hypothetical protein ACRALDRAFT_2038158 [Sodiomyces alcalophilus JCM 7366]|uniref:uncharacterized protein n=1 Tax=Sodiomyces alcalophilus JCM 7366 TaxID=591952 RepID=UPI0039B39E35
MVRTKIVGRPDDGQLDARYLLVYYYNVRGLSLARVILERFAARIGFQLTNPLTWV